MIYSEFATFYDELFDDELYQKWVEFVKLSVNPTEAILDLACGTGKLLVLLKKAGYQVTGADLSDDMLAIANSHLLEAGDTETQLLNTNMLDLSEIDKYGAITCFDDSICYLQDVDEVAKMFKEVYQHLEKGGQFLFDVITPYQTDEKYPGYMYNFNDGENAFMWTTYVGDFPHSVEHYLTFFRYNEIINGYDEYSEVHHERTYPLDVYLEALKKSGFTSVEVSANFGVEKIKDNTTRWFFRCKRD
ncbi:class I SAM-dependent methyltransferase [Fructilactobacillus vespulae]|uniref:class I SAM-dependent DNA methyltransferase n=1 Tax=Fructilactobacillus vespulae TaxID=1249630 RepID=UPI0039B4C768